MNFVGKAVAIATLGIMPATAMAQTTVDWLHIETNPGIAELMGKAAAEYDAAHDDTTINVQVLENEAFKAKLTTLLQSDAAPDVFYSWGGGVLTQQYEAGVLRDISGVVSDETRKNIGSAGIGAFTRDGKLLGIAQHVSEVVFWGNKALLEKAGVKPEDMADWDGFLASVKKIKDAGITPISLGGQDKWPAHFYWSYLVVRLAGEDGFNAARAGEGDGFAGEPFVKAGQMFLDLVALEPFQDGFLAADYPTAAGYFGDGKAALHLMGNWDYTTSKTHSASKNGIPDENLVIIPFPSVAGGAGDPTDTLGGINGWIFHRDASDAAVKFMEWYETADVQQRFAAIGAHIPIVAGGADTLKNPFFREIAQHINNAHWHAIFFDQALGPDVGGVVNDVSVELADNAISAEEAAQLVHEAVLDSK